MGAYAQPLTIRPIRKGSMNTTMFDKNTIDFAKAEENKLKALKERPHPENNNRGDGRDEFMRDYARVLYSSSFRRLQGKMQLLDISPEKFNRNRLTHSLEVAQIARSMASDLGLEDSVVAETAALAHDIGNPPFGHSGENVLNDLLKECGGFEGNAQAFRILRELEKKDNEYAGLNLTVRTMFATVKYFFNRNVNSKKFLYDRDYDFLTSKLKDNNVEIRKSIDAQIMDLADEIAYAAHDLEDALGFGLFTLGELLHEFNLDEKYNPAYQTLSDITQAAQRKALRSKQLETSEEYSAVLRKELTSNIVNTLYRDICVDDGKLGFRNHRLLAEGLKSLVFKSVFRKKDIQLYEAKGEKVIRGLFQVFSDSTFNKNGQLFPAELRSGTCLCRKAGDYISGMMDVYAIQEYQRYFGKNSLDCLYIPPHSR